jgi:hypothetical protein
MELLNDDGENCSEDIKQQIKDLMLEMIGEDETEYSNLDGSAGYWEKHGRNGFRAKLRQEVNEL